MLIVLEFSSEIEKLCKKLKSVIMVVLELFTSLNNNYEEIYLSEKMMTSTIGEVIGIFSRKN